MPYSHHSHSGQFCKHATGTLEEVVRAAVSAGFELYGLTEHVPRYRTEDLYPEEEGTSLEALQAQFDAFVAEATRLKKLYEGRITLLVGLETECITEVDLAQLKRLLEKYSGRIEYIVGSVHHVNGVPIDFDLPTFERALQTYARDGESDDSTMEAFLCAYLDEQFLMLQQFQPEIVGHADLCRLYHPGLEFVTYPQAFEKLERNVQWAVKYGALFEVNAAALRKGWDAAYPGRDVLEVIVRHGGRFALSDDSHGPHGVGLNYDRMAQYLRSAGVEALWVLEKSDAPNVAGRYTRAQKVPGKWWEHPFWCRAQK